MTRKFINLIGYAATAILFNGFILWALFLAPIHTVM